MKYKPKFQQCPYRTSDGKCTHKGHAPLKSKRKRFCGYSKPEQCSMYNEWFEIRNACQRVRESLTEPIDDWDEETNNG